MPDELDACVYPYGVFKPYIVLIRCSPTVPLWKSSSYQTLNMDVNIDDILNTLTLEEKVSLLAGKDFWQTVPIKEKGVPAIKVLLPPAFATPKYSDSQRFRTDLTVLAAKLSAMEQELHAFPLRAVPLRHGIQNFFDVSAMPLPRKLRQRAPDCCMLFTTAVFSAL